MIELTPPPRRLAARPKDRRGYPIPYMAVIRQDGTADFRITEFSRWAKVVNERRCALCGKPLGPAIAFVGGPKSMASRAFTDPGMHLDCAEYALKVCPFLAAPNFKYAEKIAEGEAVLVHNAVSTERPNVFGLGIADDYDVDVVEGTPVVRSAPFRRLRWFERGREITQTSA